MIFALIIYIIVVSILAYGLWVERAKRIEAEKDARHFRRQWMLWFDLAQSRAQKLDRLGHFEDGYFNHKPHDEERDPADWWKGEK